MNFGHRKLPKESAGQMRVCPVDSVRPYAIMASPVYVFLRANEKFISVKGPLDFFTPEDLARLRRFETFFMPEFVDCLAPFREAGRAARAILSRIHRGTVKRRQGRSPACAFRNHLDAVLRAIGPLWSRGVVVETFFLCVFADELCASLPADALEVRARDRDVRDFERALLISGALIFLALHLGYCDLAFLNLGALRKPLSA